MYPKHTQGLSQQKNLETFGYFSPYQVTHRYTFLNRLKDAYHFPIKTKKLTAVSFSHLIEQLPCNIYIKLQIPHWSEIDYCQKPIHVLTKPITNTRSRKSARNLIHCTNMRSTICKSRIVNVKKSTFE